MAKKKNGISTCKALPAYLENNGNDNNRSEKGVLVQPPENVPVIEDGSGVKLVEDLAKHECVEEDAAPPGTSSQEGAAGGGRTEVQGKGDLH